jgi:hypothetical protein
VQVASGRIDLGVRRVAVGKRAAEVAVLDRVELVGQLDRSCSGLDDGEGAAADADTLVFAPSMPPWRSPGAGSSPSASLTFVERTYRARYQSALPSPRRTPCTMPSPMNQ